MSTSCNGGDCLQLGHFRVWEPIIIVPYVAISGAYTILVQLGEQVSKQQVALEVGDALIYANPMAREGKFCFQVTQPDGSTYADADNHTYFCAEVLSFTILR